MIIFPNAKINIGLRVLRKRPDGFHDISTVMLPIEWYDILEITPSPDGEPHFLQSGIVIDCPSEKNLVIKALRKLESHLGHALPPLDIRLEKHIPFGAGLGGGSADAAFAIKAVNELLNIGLSDTELVSVAATVGADCPFFIFNRPMLATGIGEILSPVDASALNGMYLVVVKPDSESVNTAAAYSMITPKELEPESSPDILIRRPLSQWAACKDLVNDFEVPIFAQRPEIKSLKGKMLDFGALYAAMSGSGAAVFGIFNSANLAEAAAEAFADMPHMMQTLKF